MFLPEHISKQDRFQYSVQHLPDILQYDGVTELDGVLQHPHVVAVGELNYLQLVLSLHVLHPFVGLF